VFFLAGVAPGVRRWRELPTQGLVITGLPGFFFVFLPDRGLCHSGFVFDLALNSSPPPNRHPNFAAARPVCLSPLLNPFLPSLFCIPETKFFDFLFFADKFPYF